MDIESIKREYQDLLSKLSKPEEIFDWSASNVSPARQPDGSHGGGHSDASWEKFEKISKRKKKLEKIIEVQKELEEVEKQISDNKIILAAPENQELASLAETETPQLREREKKLNKQLNKLLKDLDKKESETEFNAVIVEIRAGTGGDEAALFAGDLYRMYSKFAENQNWEFRVLYSHPTDLKGFKEIIFQIKGEEVYKKMINEAGVHRVQRIPETEKTGRIHTSTATVAVLPKPKLEDIKIKTEELKIDVYKASGPGGQNVNKRETAVRITHLPTGIVVASQTERNQPLNKENAMSILAAKLLKRKEEENLSKISDARRSQIGAAKRAEKIRTYNFPQDRITDHRIKKSWHNTEKIMEGKIDEIIDAMN